MCACDTKYNNNNDKYKWLFFILGLNMYLNDDNFVHGGLPKAFQTVRGLAQLNVHQIQVKVEWIVIVKAQEK